MEKPIASTDLNGVYQVRAIAWDATHDDVDELLGLDEITHRFLMDSNAVTTQYPDAAILSEIPALKRAYGRPFSVETDKDHDW